MSLWNRTPRQVYEVYGDEDCLAGACAPRSACEARQPCEDGHPADSGAPPSECVPPELDASLKTSRSGRVLGLTLLVAVTLGAVAVVSLSLSHAPSVRQSAAERHASPAATRRAFPGPTTPAPPEVHMLAHPRRHARAPISPVAHPRRRDRRIAGGHDESPHIVIRPTGGQSAGASVGREFDFER